MKVYAGLVLLCCFGFVVAGEEPVPSDAIQHHHAMGVTTVCVQVRGPHSPVCGPMVDPPPASDKQDPSARMNPQPAMYQQRSMEQMMRSSQAFTAPPPPRGSILQDYVHGVPVYRMPAGRAQEQPPFMKPQQSPPIMSVFRVSDQPPMQNIPTMAPKCPEPVMRLAGPSYAQGMISLNQQDQFPNGPPQMRTFPFAPFGIEQQQRPLQFQMRQAQVQQPQQLMPMMRAADCPDNFQFQMPPNKAPMMKSSSSLLTETSMRQANNVDTLTKECDEQKQEILKKQDEISELKKQISKMQAAKSSSSSTMIQQKTVTTKSSQDADMTLEGKPSMSQGSKREEYQSQALIDQGRRKK